MSDEFEDSLYFPACCTLGGRIERTPLVRRNGRPMTSLAPIWREGGPREPRSQFWLDQPKYYVNLNATERQTWRRLLVGQSISSIAQEDGVTRQAIYGRIQGNAQGQGGMIAKNFWVLLWWRLRQEAKHR